jgi:hypothetical protein
MSSLIIGIDPGLATGGMVLIRVGSSSSADEVIEAISMVDKKELVDKDKKRALELIDSGINRWGDREFTATMLRTERWVKKAIKEISKWEKEYGPIEKIAIESFVDQPSRAKQLIKLRWQTPLLIGAFVERLKDLGYREDQLIYQNAGTVLKQWQTELDLLKNDKRKKRARQDEMVIVKGDWQITNDHLRKALVHGLALAIRMRENKLVKN